jgi:hypothetical protein
MPDQFTRTQIDESSQKLTHHISMIMNSDVNTAETFFLGFISFCECDEVIKSITAPLKEVNIPFEEWWNRVWPNGRRKFEIPEEPLKRSAFLYQLCFKIFNHEIGFNYLSVGLEYFGSVHANDNIRKFNLSVIQPLHDYIYTNLNRLQRSMRSDILQTSPSMINVSGNNSRININSVDRSTNIINSIDMRKFDEIESILYQIRDERVKTVCLTSFNELKESVGTESYIPKYQQFIATVADHVAIATPLMTFLASLLSY